MQVVSKQKKSETVKTAFIQNVFLFPDRLCNVSSKVTLIHQPSVRKKWLLYRLETVHDFQNWMAPILKTITSSR